MSVHINIPPYKTIVDHVSSGGWEIDKYSDGTWQGSYRANIPSTAITNTQGPIYRSNVIPYPSAPAGFTAVRFVSIAAILASNIGGAGLQGTGYYLWAAQSVTTTGILMAIADGVWS
jgi:uncharacterized protein YbjT (DUF2867 family)